MTGIPIASAPPSVAMSMITPFFAMLAMLARRRRAFGRSRGATAEEPAPEAHEDSRPLRNRFGGPDARRWSRRHRCRRRWQHGGHGRSLGRRLLVARHSRIG